MAIKSTHRGPGKKKKKTEYFIWRESHWLHVPGEGKGRNEEETVKCVFKAK